MATEYNITLRQGDSYELTFTYTDPDGVAKNMSGFTYQMDVREGYVNSDLVFSLTEGSGIDSTSESAGVLTISITSAQTALLTKGVYRYDLKLTDLGGDSKRELYGTVIAEKNVTP